MWEKQKMDYLEYARSTFKNDRFATNAAGIVIDRAEKNFAVCSMQVQPIHLNAAGAVMGGALFTLADFAFAVASNVGEPLTVSVSSQISYLSPAFGSKLTATAHCLKAGKTTCTFLIDVTDESGRAVASVTTTGCRTNKTV